MGHQFPLIRTIEPADKVYKKCKNDVIVVAEIPKTAQVRGSIDGKCRASEAVIVEIIASSSDCVDAVSWWDEKTTYKVGITLSLITLTTPTRNAPQGSIFSIQLRKQGVIRLL